MAVIRTIIIRTDATSISFQSPSWHAARITVIREANLYGVGSTAPVYMSDITNGKPYLERHTVGSIRQENEMDGIFAA